MKQGEKYDASKLQERHRDHAWFIGFAPADKPKIAMAVLVENGGHGGTVAAPIARKLMDYYLLGKEPNKPAPLPVSAQSGVPAAKVGASGVGASAVEEEEHD
jgi:penicillin-binding protein 2